MTMPTPTSGGHRRTTPRTTRPRPSPLPASSNPSSPSPHVLVSREERDATIERQRTLRVAMSILRADLQCADDALAAAEAHANVCSAAEVELTRRCESHGLAARASLEAVQRHREQA